MYRYRSNRELSFRYVLCCANRSPSDTKTGRVHAHVQAYITLPRAQLDSPSEYITSNACDTNNSIDFAVRFALILIDMNPLCKCAIH